MWSVQQPVWGSLEVSLDLNQNSKFYFIKLHTEIMADGDAILDKKYHESVPFFRQEHIVLKNAIMKEMSDWKYESFEVRQVTGFQTAYYSKWHFINTLKHVKSFLFDNCVCFVIHSD